VSRAGALVGVVGEDRAILAGGIDLHCLAADRYKTLRHIGILANRANSKRGDGFPTRPSPANIGRKPVEDLPAAATINLQGIMQRDMDLIRQILLKIEEQPGGFAPGKLEIEGYTGEEIGYHVWLLDNAGLLKGVDVTSHGSPAPKAIPINLTWDGHDFIAAARSESVWSQAKGQALKVGGTLSLAVMKQLLDHLMKVQLGI
jgi:hypothetical protein